MTISKSYTGGVSDVYHLPILDPSDLDEDGRWDTEISAILEKRYVDIVENNLKGASRSFIATDGLTKGRGVVSESDMTIT